MNRRREFVVYSDVEPEDSVTVVIPAEPDPGVILTVYEKDGESAEIVLDCMGRAALAAILRDWETAAMLIGQKGST